MSEHISRFPILRGTSVAESGEFSGHVVIVCSPEDLNHEWASDSIAVLSDEMELYFQQNPKYLDKLFGSVRAVLAEFGESISHLATHAAQHDTLAVVRVEDATHVLENDMHIRIEAVENQGDIFFID